MSRSPEKCAQGKELFLHLNELSGEMRDVKQSDHPLDRRLMQTIAN